MEPLCAVRRAHSRRSSWRKPPPPSNLPPLLPLPAALITPKTALHATSSPHTKPTNTQPSQRFIKPKIPTAEWTVITSKRNTSRRNTTFKRRPFVQRRKRSSCSKCTAQTHSTEHCPLFIMCFRCRFWGHVAKNCISLYKRRYSFSSESNPSTRINHSAHHHNNQNQVPSSFESSNYEPNPLRNVIFIRVRGLHIYKGNFIIDNGISETRGLFRKKNLKCLRTLVLNPIGSIPFPLSIVKLIMLRYLQISKLKCQRLPESICSLWNLQFLHVNDCEQLTALPNDVGKLCNLRTLDLSWCGSIETLPDTMGSCKNLRSLILRGCRTIIRIPISVSQLENLRVLNLSSCNMLENFAEHFFENFKELHNLNLYYCSNIMELPSSIGNLQKLRTLNLSECSKIQQLPTSLGTLQSIETINLSACKIKSLPDSIGNLENLRVLNLSFCRALTSLPTSISNLHRLCSLLLRGTRLSSLPPQISKLVNLECLDIHECNHLKHLPEGLGKMSNLRYLKNKGCRSLLSTSRGIGALTQLQELDIFAVGNTRYASISELENLDLLINELGIRHLQELKSLLEAEKAQLERKQNLYGLRLEWTGRDTPDLSLKKLDCLRPNKNIKSFILSGYPAATYPNWMMGIEKNTTPFPNLTYLDLRDIKCNSLPQVEFPHLKSLCLCFMDELLSIKGQQFPSLNSLVLQSMPKLSDLWPTIADEDQKSSHPKPVCTWPIVHLSIWQCPNLKIHPFIPPSVERLELESSNEALLSDVKTNLFEPLSTSSMMLPYSTKKLSIYDITASSGWKLLHHLSLLTELTIQNCSELKQLPESLRGLTDLRELKVDCCENLTELPEWLGELRSLKTLTIGKCPGLKSLPSSISTLTALQAIVLDDCPVLAKRCKKEVGEDRHLVSHVPIIFIY